MPKKIVETKNKDDSSAGSTPKAGASGGKVASPLSMNDELMAVVTHITNAFTTTFSTCVDRLIDTIEKKINFKIDVQQTEIFDLSKRIDVLEKSYRDVCAENASLRDTIQSMNNRADTLAQSVDELDQYSRGSNILVHGAPVSTVSVTENDLRQNMLHLLNTTLGVTIGDQDLIAVHRLPRHSNSTASASTRPPPVIIQFANKRIRNAILSKRKDLKGSKITLTEQLTSTRAALLRKANELAQAKKIQTAWSHDGRVLVRTLADRTIIIGNLHDLDQF